MGVRLTLVGLLALVACSGPSAEPATTVPPPATSVPATSTTRPDFAALCNGYLVMLRSGEAEALRAELEGDVEADLDVMLSSEGEFAAIAAAALRVEEYVVERCADRFALGVEPAADDPTALRTFLTALADGDQERAGGVAWENVVAQFTWQAVDSGEIVVEGSRARMDYGGTGVECEASGGVVVSCRFTEN